MLAPMEIQILFLYFWKKAQIDLQDNIGSMVSSDVLSMSWRCRNYSGLLIAYKANVLQLCHLQQDTTLGKGFDHLLNI